MQVQLEVFLEIVFTLYFLKVFHNCFLESISVFTLINSLCCLAFFLLYSVFKVHECTECTLKIEQ